MPRTAREPTKGFPYHEERLKAAAGELADVEKETARRIARLRSKRAVVIRAASADGMSYDRIAEPVGLSKSVVAEIVKEQS